jgi:hypothetical protein
MPTSFTITISTLGPSTGPFKLYSNVDGYTTAFATGVTRAQLLAGYTTTAAPLATTSVKVVSTGACTTFLNINLT